MLARLHIERRIQRLRSDRLVVARHDVNHAAFVRDIRIADAAVCGIGVIGRRVRDRRTAQAQRLFAITVGASVVARSGQAWGSGQDTMCLASHPERCWRFTGVGS